MYPDVTKRIGTLSAMRFGAYCIDPAARRLLHHDRHVEVEGKVFDLILILLRNRDRALGKQELVAELWGHEAISDAALSQLVYKARRALGDDGERQAVIRTVFGRGMQWVALVDAVESCTDENAVRPPEAVTGSNAKPAKATRRDPHWYRLRWLWGSLGILLLITLLSLSLVRRGAAPPPATWPRVAILPLQNLTGDAALDWSVQGVPALISSLLATTPGVNVIDPLEVARVSGFSPPAGRSQANHTRQVTHADILVDGQLRKLADHVYELDLRVDRGGEPRTLNLSGASPSALAISAVRPLRTALGLRHDPASTQPALPEDGYLAESFARGMDLAEQGHWQDAQPYFALVAKGEPDYLPATYRLGEALVKTGQHEKAESALKSVAASATRHGQPRLAASAYTQLAMAALMRHDYAATLSTLAQAEPLAVQSGDTETQIEIMLTRARAHARLLDSRAAKHELELASRLIAQHKLPQLQAMLTNARIFVADTDGDAQTMEAAARASLEANNAMGDQRGSFGALFNLGYALNAQGRGMQAIPLWNAAIQWARKQGDYPMQSLASYYLASTLAEAGLEDKAAALFEQLLVAARQQNDLNTEHLALGARAELEWRSGKTGQALQTMQQARQLLDPEQDPAGALDDLLGEAFIALGVEPQRIVGIRRDADTLIASQPDRASYQRKKWLLYALAAAASGDDIASQNALNAARGRGSESPYEVAERRQIALLIGTVRDDAAVADIALGDLDIKQESSSSLLTMAARWFEQHGQTDRHAQVLERLRELRETATRHLDAPVDTPAKF